MPMDTPPPRGAALSDDDRLLVAHCAGLSFPSASRSPPSATASFQVHHASHPYPCAAFVFPPTWSAAGWMPPSLDAGGRAPFGDAEVDPALFPSLRSVGSGVPARASAAFVAAFRGLLDGSPLQTEVSKAVAEEKRVVFTGHSSGGSIATLAAIWFLENCTRRGSVNQAQPFCVTFGAPLVGDNVFNHAVRREGWSQCILHFIMPLDIIPRIPLAPLASSREQIQSVLDWLSPHSPNFSPVGNSLVIPEFYETLLRSTLSIASYEACSFMGCTSSILGTLTSFIELSPYRPCGTYLFLTSTEQLVILTNSDAVLQLLFYCLQLDPQQQLLDAAARSLSAHWQYESIKQNMMQEVVCVDYLRAISSSLPGTQMNGIAIGGLELSKEAMLSLAAAAQWEKQREINQAKIDANCSKIQEALKSLNEYKRTCELHEVSYYDSFKLQREVHDFNSNVRRLELAGLWDEIIEMLRRRELPDAFEGREEWVNLGTSYRRLVEPLDIANYYRHSKNEDTGSYLSKGRPRRYKYTQKWREQSHRIPLGSSLESCFWAMSEELQAEMINGKSFEDLKDRVGKLESDALGWFTSGTLGKDVFLSSSSFVIWWKTLPEQHRSASCIARLVPS
ncbi:protein EDS1L-like [Hordeum vulgare]|uniref:Enhanced disease susceptibility 1 n=1 Tax=Hordeum vulgare subsp. vulgare TaxID=112509 RepID=A0A8I6XQ42_HORVV|nr:protein EDS1L-like [Hordeum vulgare subsp. vulgare]KAE8816490.1 protein EDS1L-like [Hordeum vulgare]